MKKSPERALLDDAGKLYVVRQELAAARAERERIEERIRQLERREGEARRAYDATVGSIVKRPRAGEALDDLAVAPGKLPHRVLSRMQRMPQSIHTAAELASDLGIKDVQQVRTALARLLAKGLVRRVGNTKGQFTA
jgi:hypothetical protein